MRSLRRCGVAAAVVAALLLTLAPVLPAAAQTSDGSANSTPDLVPVAVWTVVTIVLLLGVAGVGYLYRRENGMDHPLKAPPIEPTVEGPAEPAMHGVEATAAHH